jgi:hypothetical protein
MLYRLIFRLVFCTRFEPWLYRFVCPYPVGGILSPRRCYRAGQCGCDNACRYATRGIVTAR